MSPDFPVSAMWACLVIGVGLVLISIVTASWDFASSRKAAAGYTRPLVPAAMKTSQDIAAACALVMASVGSISPNQTTSGLKNPPVGAVVG